MTKKKKKQTSIKIWYYFKHQAVNWSHCLTNILFYILIADKSPNPHGSVVYIIIPCSFIPNFLLACQKLHDCKNQKSYINYLNHVTEWFKDNHTTYSQKYNRVILQTVDHASVSSCYWCKWTSQCINGWHIKKNVRKMLYIDNNSCDRDFGLLSKNVSSQIRLSKFHIIV